MSIRLTACLLSFLLCASPAFAAGNACEAFARTTTSQLVAIFHDASLSEDQKRDHLTTLFQNDVDTNWIGQFALGHYWNTASAEERAAYLKEYRTYLTNSYVSKFDDEASLSVEEIKIASVSPVANSSDYSAKSLILRKGEDDIHVDYLLSQTPVGCKVHDIIIENVSLLVSQRSEFQSILNSSGIKGLTEALKNKKSD